MVDGTRHGCAGLRDRADGRGLGGDGFGGDVAARFGTGEPGMTKVVGCATGVFFFFFSVPRTSNVVSGGGNKAVCDLSGFIYRGDVFLERILAWNWYMIGEMVF